MSRNALAAITATVALVLQVAIVNRLPLPGGVAPDVVLLAVVALALTDGPLPGLVTGFCVGLAADLVPPADHTIGRYALVYCLIGYVCGLVSKEMDRSAVLPFVAVAVGALAGTSLYLGVGMLLGDPRANWSMASRVLPLSVFYDVIFSPFVVWTVLWLSRLGERKRDRAGLGAVPGFQRAR